ncbi:jg10550 [Pararge aegeria aegeria]|uniref:Jg10550 protein n=1 Tax=Pararge aegeria aegeria TaxID=348720 RepID=A0A8S4RV80_9NEOP|nr:jg10550 [Pararge aegeria aegeria]
MVLSCHVKTMKECSDPLASLVDHGESKAQSVSVIKLGIGNLTEKTRVTNIAQRVKGHSWENRLTFGSQGAGKATSGNSNVGRP